MILIMVIMIPACVVLRKNIHNFMFDWLLIVRSLSDRRGKFIMYDYLTVGSGLFGAVFAYEAK